MRISASFFALTSQRIPDLKCSSAVSVDEHRRQAFVRPAACELSCSEDSTLTSLYVAIRLPQDYPWRLHNRFGAFKLQA